MSRYQKHNVKAWKTWRHWSGNNFNGTTCRKPTYYAYEHDASVETIGRKEIRSSCKINMIEASELGIDIEIDVDDSTISINIEHTIIAEFIELPDA